MGRIRITRPARARAGVLTGGALASTGAGLGLGPAVGLAVGGLLLMAYCLLLMDVDGADGGG